MVREGRVPGRTRNRNTHVILIRDSGLASGSESVYGCTPCWDQVELGENGRINTGATCARVHQSLYTDGVWNSLIGDSKGCASGLAHPNVCGENQASVWRYLTGEIWHGTNRDMN